MAGWRGAVALAVCAWLGVQSVRADDRPFEDLICSYPWSCAQAMKVATCESTLNPNAYSAGNYGLFAVNYGAHAEMVGPDSSVLFDPETNVRIAWQLYSAESWRPWAYCGR